MISNFNSNVNKIIIVTCMEGKLDFAIITKT